jgi:hypothetical protein
MARVVKQFTISGTSFIPGAWANVKRLRPGVELTLVREPNNPYDPSAVAVRWGGVKIGYLPNAAMKPGPSGTLKDGVRCGLATEIAPLLDRGVQVLCTKSKRIGPTAGYIQDNQATLVLAYEEQTNDGLVEPEPDGPAAA